MTCGWCVSALDLTFQHTCVGVHDALIKSPPDLYTLHKDAHGRLLGVGYCKSYLCEKPV